jgi:DNA-binding PucR family transcriptional regulator
MQFGLLHSSVTLTEDGALMTSETARTELAEWVHQYAVTSATDENVEAFVDHVDSAILREIPEIANDPVLVADLHASTKVQFQVFLSLVEREEPELLLPPQAVGLALSIARRQLELNILLKVYRIAGAAVWDYFTQVASEVPADGPDRSDVLIYLWDHGGTWINEAIEQLINVFYAEREATMHGTLARRTETVHALLAGDQVAVDDAVTLLGHPLRQHQLAMVLWSGDGSTPDALVDLNKLAAAVAAAVGSTVLTIPAGRAEVWCWLAHSSPISPEQVTDTVNSSQISSDVRVAIGGPGSGLEGFRDSHHEAVDAQHFAIAGSPVARCTFYRDVELQCLVASNGRGVSTLIRRELGGLGAEDPSLDRVRETVSTFLTHGGSVDQTATALFVHKNTVRYRLSQAEELIGHPLSERRTEISLALRCFRQRG